MTTLRVNTLRCELVPDETRTTIKDMINWIFEDLILYTDNLENELIGIQHDPTGMYLKFKNTKTCEEIINRTKGEGKIKKLDGNIANILISMSTIGIKRIRVLRMPFEFENINIAKNLSQYGEVIDIQDEYWSESMTNHKLKFKNGNRIVTCKLKEHIPSFISINGIKALITYEGQPKTCSYCNSPMHMIANCPNKTKKTTSYSEAARAPITNLGINYQDNRTDIFEDEDIVNCESEDSQMDTSQVEKTFPILAKRPLLSSHSDNNDQTSGEEQEQSCSKSPSKKTKTGKKYLSKELCAAETIDFTENSPVDQPSRIQTLQNIKDIIEDYNNKFLITVEELDILIENCQTTKNVMECVKAYTTQFEQLSDTLIVIKQHIKDDRKTKLWITKIIDGIRKYLESEYLRNSSVKY